MAPHGVLVIGFGMAGLCAAIESRLNGANVVLVDAAPESRFGGNARHARNVRVVHDTPLPWVPDHYKAQELSQELAAVGGEPGGPVFEQWARQSASLVQWLSEQGVRYQSPASRNRRYSRRTAFLLGGGQALVGALRQRLAALGVPVRMACRVTALASSTGVGESVRLEQRGGASWLHPGAVVVAAGGAHWDPDWLARAYPDSHAALMCRGTPENRGELLRALQARGAASAGRSDAAHMVAVDARGPVVDGGIVTRLDGLDLGLVMDAVRGTDRVLGRIPGSRESGPLKWGPLVHNSRRMPALMARPVPGRKEVTWSGVALGGPGLGTRSRIR